MVGDSITDISTARAAGVPVIAVDFGYTRTHVSQLGPDSVISNYAALGEAIATLRSRHDATETGCATWLTAPVSRRGAISLKIFVKLSASCTSTGEFAHRTAKSLKIRSAFSNCSNAASRSNRQPWLRAGVGIRMYCQRNGRKPDGRWTDDQGVCDAGMWRVGRRLFEPSVPSFDTASSRCVGRRHLGARRKQPLRCGSAFPNRCNLPYTVHAWICRTMASPASPLRCRAIIPRPSRSTSRRPAKAAICPTAGIAEQVRIDPNPVFAQLELVPPASTAPGKATRCAAEAAPAGAKHRSKSSPRPRQYSRAFGPPPGQFRVSSPAPLFVACALLHRVRRSAPMTCGNNWSQSRRDPAR